MNTYFDRGKGQLWKATISVQFATPNWMPESIAGTTMTSKNVNNLSHGLHCVIRDVNMMAKFENFCCCHKGYSTKLLVRAQTWIPDKDRREVRLQELPVMKLNKIVQRKKQKREWTTTKLANKFVFRAPVRVVLCTIANRMKTLLIKLPWVFIPYLQVLDKIGVAKE